ncbi:hypothetical protein CPC08DRAFT_527620 [Agrocybe pediades]|nr:hypothetical protein CPC08DRAFT_527620 [Agrocybe pediades]
MSNAKNNKTSTVLHVEARRTEEATRDTRRVTLDDDGDGIVEADDLPASAGSLCPPGLLSSSSSAASMSKPAQGLPAACMIAFLTLRKSVSPSRRNPSYGCKK